MKTITTSASERARRTASTDRTRSCDIATPDRVPVGIHSSANVWICDRPMTATRTPRIVTTCGA